MTCNVMRSVKDKSVCLKKFYSTVTHSFKWEEVGLLWCSGVTARLCLLASVVAAVQDQKANRALTTLDLAQNDCGDAGAAALAKALKATVLTFS